MRDNDGNVFTQWHSSLTTLLVPCQHFVYFVRIEADNIHRCCRAFFVLSFCCPFFFFFFTLQRVARKNNSGATSQLTRYYDYYCCLNNRNDCAIGASQSDLRCRGIALSVCRSRWSRAALSFFCLLIYLKYRDEAGRCVARRSSSRRLPFGQRKSLIPPEPFTGRVPVARTARRRLAIGCRHRQQPVRLAKAAPACDMYLDVVCRPNLPRAISPADFVILIFPLFTVFPSCIYPRCERRDDCGRIIL